MQRSSVGGVVVVVVVVVVEVVVVVVVVVVAVAPGAHPVGLQQQMRTRLPVGTASQVLAAPLYCTLLAGKAGS